MSGFSSSKKWYLGGNSQISLLLLHTLNQWWHKETFCLATLHFKQYAILKYLVQILHSPSHGARKAILPVILQQARLQLKTWLKLVQIDILCRILHTEGWTPYTLFEWKAEMVTHSMLCFSWVIVFSPHLKYVYDIHLALCTILYVLYGVLRHTSKYFRSWQRPALWWEDPGPTTIHTQTIVVTDHWCHTPGF